MVHDHAEPRARPRRRRFIGSRARLYLRTDYGGTEHTATSTVQGRVKGRLLSHLSVTAGYPRFHVRPDGTIAAKPITLRQTLHGPIVGIGIPF